MDKDFLSAISALPYEFQKYFASLDCKLTKDASEIRLREGCRIALTVRGRTVLLSDANAPQVNSGAIGDIFMRLCRGSVYAHKNEIVSGFITAPGGHRVGICGRAVCEDGVIDNITDITSLCIRIARRHKSSAEKTVTDMCIKGCSVLLFGPPLSGKTTILRETAISLAKEGKRVCVVDEKQEIIQSPCDGIDIFKSYPRKTGIEHAIRLFSPQILIFDELGSQSDSESLLYAAYSGVSIVTTAHAADYGSLRKRTYLKNAINGGIFDRYVMLGCGEAVGSLVCIYNKEGESVEDGFDNTDGDLLFCSRQDKGDEV